MKKNFTRLVTMLFLLGGTSAVAMSLVAGNSRYSKQTPARVIVGLDSTVTDSSNLPKDSTSGDSSYVPGHRYDNVTIKIDSVQTDSGKIANIIFCADENVKGDYSIPDTLTLQDGNKAPVTKIAEGAFENNKNLKAVTIPETITKIGEKAFAGCENLKEVGINNENPPILASLENARSRAAASTLPEFEGVNLNECILYVPTGSANTYRSTQGWNLFQNIKEKVFPTGITAPASDTKKQPATSHAVYTLTGVKVADKWSNNLPKGIYIVNGKKIIK